VLGRSRLAAGAALILALPGIGLASASAATATAAPALAHHGLAAGALPFGAKPQHSFSTQRTVSKNLTYYGGKVLANIKIVQVRYGSGTYQNYVGTGSGTTGAFYSAIAGSSYVGWLNSNYATTSPAQTIGLGTFAGQYTITPSAANAPSTQKVCTSSGSLRVTDAQIQAELKLQVANKVLPAPDANTYYAVYFPAGVGIQQGTSCSGVSGGFCAYHGTVAASSANPEFYYGVLPDFTTAGMATGCGSAATPFGNVTSVSSHEMTETITDAQVGIATKVGAPLAWYNSTYGEIGDLCNAQQASVVGTDGVTYVVQKEWSNSAGACRT